MEEIKIGHAEDKEGFTGCTVIICPKGAVAGVDVRGSAPGTRETDLLNPVMMVEKVHAILLAGGSAFGLAAADGVMKYLEEKGIGFDVGVTRVPIVPGAVIFDLGLGDYRARPDCEMGYQACLNAVENNSAEGCVGAGIGASVGKIKGMEWATKSGLGMAHLKVGEVEVSALVVVNALGDVIDPETGKIIAGVRNESGFESTEEIFRVNYKKVYKFTNTTIGVVFTNAKLNKAQAKKLAQVSHQGLVRTIRPIHTQFDGDTLFALSYGDLKVDFTLLGIMAADAVSQAVVRAVKTAVSMGGLPAMKDLMGVLKDDN
ncbi:peptidase S58 [Anoxybacter fermentans]|uniref:Peptidase S58 n=1 Tax=Anoxybacter fermentans TaxID=1323375 RepID=A0A3Q9HPE7_9FIRM|nr:P1 family peptidase [Anoxybacter fermentans]AZR72477.1 peptidase S58 [Anoxybacter fermentans]